MATLSIPGASKKRLLSSPIRSVLLFTLLTSAGQIAEPHVHDAAAMNTLSSAHAYCGGARDTSSN